MNWAHCSWCGFLNQLTEGLGLEAGLGSARITNEGTCWLCNHTISIILKEIKDGAN